MVKTPPRSARERLNNGETTRVRAERSPKEESSEKLLETLESALEMEGTKPNRYRTKKDVRAFTAKEERYLGKKRKNSKKYDGRLTSKNAQVSLPAIREVLTGFYDSVKLPELKQALELSNDPRYLTLLAALNNPRFMSTSFPELCRRCKMTLQDVVEVWRNHVRNQGMVRMMGHLPDVMEDLAVDSKSRVVLCQECQGEGRLREKKVNGMSNPICPVCHGDGKVRLLGDKDARTLMFETVGLKKGGGTQINMMQLNAAGGVPSIEDQIASVDKIFDAEVVEEDENADNGQEGLPETEKAAEPDRKSPVEAAPETDPVADADARWDALAESADPTNYSG